MAVVALSGLKNAFHLPCLLNWYEQIWVSCIQFEFSPVSSRGVMPRLPCWNGHSAAHRVIPKPGLLGFSAQLDPSLWHCL